MSKQGAKHTNQRTTMKTPTHIIEATIVTKSDFLPQQSGKRVHSGIKVGVKRCQKAPKG